MNLASYSMRLAHLKARACAVLTLAALTWGAAVPAAMVGDEIEVAQYFPSFGTINGGNVALVTVAEGGDDKIDFGVLRINANDEAAGQPSDPNVAFLNFVVGGTQPKTFGAGDPGPDGGNFFGASGIDFFGDPTKVIIAIALVETFDGIVAGDVRWGDDFAFLNIGGHTGDPGDRVILELTFGQAAPPAGVPLPAGAYLLLSALGCLLLSSRRISAAG